MDQKRIRQQEEHKLEEERAIVYQERSSIEDQKRVLEAREAKLSIGIEFTHPIAWINVIREYASRKMVDERTAVWRLAEGLKLARGW